MRHVTINLLAVLIFGCSQPNQPALEGRWSMFRVIQIGSDVTAEHNPENERYLLLKPDSTFETGGRPYGSNTGKFSYKPSSKKLFLDSDAGPEDDSQWVVTLNADTMHWRGFGTEWADDFELIHLRVK